MPGRLETRMDTGFRGISLRSVQAKVYTWAVKVDGCNPHGYWHVANPSRHPMSFYKSVGNKGYGVKKIYRHVPQPQRFAFLHGMPGRIGRNQRQCLFVAVQAPVQVYTFAWVAWTD